LWQLREHQESRLKKFCYSGDKVIGRTTAAPGKAVVMTSNETYGPESSRVIDNSAYVPNVIPTYVALGFFEEYLGRGWIEGSETVERFYPGEKQLVPRFVSILHDVAAERKMTTQIRQEVGRQGHIAVISPELAAYFNGLYPLVQSRGVTYPPDSDGCERHVMGAEIRTEMFPEMLSREYKPDEVDCRFSFLLGCHFRYGNNNSFQFANATHKVQLLIEFLERLGAKWISWTWTVNRAPRSNRIEFGPDAVLTRFLGLKAESGASK
jgi:hypothetical protein